MKKQKACTFKKQDYKKIVFTTENLADTKNMKSAIILTT